MVVCCTPNCSLRFVICFSGDRPIGEFAEENMEILERREILQAQAITERWEDCQTQAKYILYVTLKFKVMYLGHSSWCEHISSRGKYPQLTLPQALESTSTDHRPLFPFFIPDILVATQLEGLQRRKGTKYVKILLPQVVQTDLYDGQLPKI